MIQEPPIKILLEEGQTLIIPTGWIHAVYTPQDSLVFGGNFLHGLEIKKQLSINSLETRTRVPGKFRFPSYLELQFYAACMYLEMMKAGTVCQREVNGLKDLLYALKEWWKLQSSPAMVVAAQGAAMESGYKLVEDMIEAVEKERNRILRDGICQNPIYQKKPKLRLSIAAPLPKKESGFRITLPSSSLYAMPHRKSSKPEGIDEFVPGSDEGAEEWKPRKPVAGTITKAAKKVKSVTSPAAKSKIPVKSNKPVSSRQRLLKRFK